MKTELRQTGARRRLPALVLAAVAVLYLPEAAGLELEEAAPDTQPGS